MNLQNQFRTPARNVAALGSAKSGVHHWWMQRVSAVGVAILGIWFVVSLYCLGGFDYVSVTGWIANPCNAALLVLWVGALLYHSKLGIQVVVEDYFRGATKTVMLVLSTLLHVALAVFGVVAVLRIALSIILGSAV
jgi:succinate dehydrogenase / fumarate reductase, membrane anchor subunit